MFMTSQRKDSIIKRLKCAYGREKGREKWSRSGERGREGGRLKERSLGKLGRLKPKDHTITGHVL